MKSVCVVGSINKDITLLVKRLPEDGDNIYAQSVIQKCGGKGANAAVALAKLGVDTLFYGCIGRDGHGIELKLNLEKYGVNTKYISVKDSASGIAYILLDEEGHNRIIVAPGANEEMSKEDILNKAYPLMKESEVVLTQLEISKESILEIVRICKKENKKLIVDAGPTRGIRAELLSGVFCICPSIPELEALIERKLYSIQEITEAAEELLALNVQQVIVRLGSKGCLFISQNKKLHIPAYSVKAIDPTAEGDSFIAGYCKSLLAGKNIEECLDYALKCSAFAVTRMGATSSLPTEEDIKNFNLLPRL